MNLLFPLNLILPFIAIRLLNKKSKRVWVFVLWFLTLLGICFDVYNAFYGWTYSFLNQIYVRLLIVVPLLVFCTGSYLFFFKTKSLKIAGGLLISIGFISYLVVEFMLAFRM